MREGRVDVEQVNKRGVFVIDHDEIQSPSELISTFKTHFYIDKVESKIIYGFYKEKRFGIIAKNVSYLGIPHPSFKKRIQIPTDFKSRYDQISKEHIETLLMGVYRYKDVLLFCDFDITKYKNNKSNNSSAHVFTNDFKHALKSGIFQRCDSKGNIITVFTPENINKFLQHKLFGEDNVRYRTIKKLDTFFSSLEKKWYGISCFEEMAKGNFFNRNQAEWPGAFLEYKMKQFIEDGQVDEIIYSQNKKKGQIDLDLFFPELDSYGDLKAHTYNTSGIQGNDQETIMDLLEDKSVYYIVCNHETIMDKDCNFEVTKRWNEILGKKDLYSYKNKMKNSVILKEYMVLEINKHNAKFLKEFKQGKNSNGKSRNPKISIPKKNIDYFLIHKLNLTSK